MVDITHFAGIIKIAGVQVRAVLKADIDKFLEADGELNVCHLKVKAQEEKLNLLTEQVKSIMSLSFNVGNAIKWKKFLNVAVGEKIVVHL